MKRLFSAIFSILLVASLFAVSFFVVGAQEEPTGTTAVCDAILKGYQNQIDGDGVRIVAEVGDPTGYREIGFRVTSGNVTRDFPITTVFSTLTAANDEGRTYEALTAEEGRYLYALAFRDIPATALFMTVTPYTVDADGVTLFGTSKTIAKDAGGTFVQERTVSGTVTVTGETLDPTKLSSGVGSVECNADGTYTIHGINPSTTEVTLTYENYYAETLTIGTDAHVTGKDANFCYRVMENYKNALGYNSNPLGDVAKSFTLGWGHNARMKGLYLSVTDTRDFVVQTVIRQFGNDPSKDGSYISAGVSLDLYKADGTLSRNLTFRYKQTTQTLIVEAFGGETYQKEITTELTLPKPIGTDATAWNVALIRASGSYYFAIGTVADGTYSVIPVDLSDFTLDATETQVGFGVAESNDQHAYFTDCAFLVGTEATAYAGTTFGLGQTFDVTVSASTGATVTIKDAQGTTYGNGDTVAGSKRLIVTISVADGYAVKAFTVQVGDQTVTVTGNTYTIGMVNGDVEITVTTEAERTMEGIVTVTGETLDPTKLSSSVGSVECNADGTYTIHGIGSDVTTVTLTYANYYAETFTIGSEVHATGKNADFCYRIVENYSNALNYYYGTIGDTTKQFTLGWGHSARLKGLYLPTANESDFILTATITKMQNVVIYAGPSLDLYTADGTITRNIIFGYRVSDQKLVIMTMTKKGDAYKIDTTVETGLTLSSPDGTEAKYIEMALMRIDGTYYVAVGQNGDGSYSKLFAIDASLLTLQSDETQMGFGVSASGQQYTVAKDVLFRLGTEATAYAGTTFGFGETFDVTINASSGATVTIKDAQGTTYGNGDTVAGSKLLTVTVSVADGYAVKSFTLKAGDQTVIVTGNTYTIDIVNGDVEITVVVEAERTVSGNLSISGGEALDPTKFTTNVGSVECSADGSFTIRGIGSDVTELTLSYANYYDETLSIGSDATVTGKTVAFRYRVIENYKNGKNYYYGTLGDTTKEFTLGWAHSARLKGLYLSVTDTRDFALQTTIVKMDSTDIYAGPSLDLYTADGTITRNVIFGYRVKDQKLVIMTLTGKGDAYVINTTVETGLTLARPDGTAANRIDMALIRVDGAYYVAIGQNGDGTYSKTIALDAGLIAIQSDEAQMGFGASASGQQYTVLTNTALLVDTEATAFATGKVPAKEEE